MPEPVGEHPPAEARAGRYHDLPTGVAERRSHRRKRIHLLAARLGDRPDLQRYFDRALRGVQSIAEMVSHMARITRLAPLAHLDTAGVPILDLRGSSQPAEPTPAHAPEPGPAPGEPPRPL